VSALALVCLPVTSPAPAEPERDLTASPAVQLNHLQLPATLTMEPIRSAELVPGGSMAVVFDGNHIPAAPIETQTSRRLPSLWRMEIDPVAPTAYLAQYELVSADGRVGGLSLVGGDAFIPVAVESIEPILSRGLDGGTRLEGGVSLHLSFAEVTRSGNYSGTLIVTLNRF
jgi:hypothetical protein